jgi:hypothetical protein
LKGEEGKIGEERKGQKMKRKEWRNEAGGKGRREGK